MEVFVALVPCGFVFLLGVFLFIVHVIADKFKWRDFSFCAWTVGVATIAASIAAFGLNVVKLISLGFL